MWKYIASKTARYALLLLGAITVVYLILDLSPGDPAKCILGKPVILLYPEEEMEVTVKLETAGPLTTVYPSYPETGWQVTAAPDGMLTGPDGTRYTSLFWEAEGLNAFDFSTGFCVKGSDTAAFLEEALHRMGLNDRERCDFIQYWLPQMEKNPYNILSFQQEAYTDQARLTVTPEPDSLLRVFMAWKPSAQPVEMAPQTFAPFTRTGFTVVEWGGSKAE